MKEYLKISLAISFLGFLKEMRFIEPFLTDYLSSNFDNVTVEVINQEIFPVGTYSHVVQLLIIFLITDYLRYKPLIVILGLSSAAIWGTMLVVKGKLGLQVIEVFYGTFSACEVAYFSYIYNKTEKQYYQIVTSHTRSAILFGRFVSAFCAQLLSYYNVLDYRQLNITTFVFQVITALWSIFFIPPVTTSIYFHRKDLDENNHKGKTYPFLLLWNHFYSSFTKETVILWSIFYTISFGLYYQITAYIQVLWITIDSNVQWNPLVDVILTLLSGCAMLLAGKVHVKYFESTSSTVFILAITCLIKCLLIYFAAISRSLLVCYILYVCYGILYSFSITICAFKIAENILEESHGLVFGFNTFIALLIQTCLTLVVVSNGFKLSPAGQYSTYSAVYLALAITYLLKLLVDCWRRKNFCIKS